MEQSTILRRTSLLADSAGPPPKRRKLRKGTQSCWDCKRRKARCTISADTPETCDSCKRRGVDCVSQEVTDQPPPPGSNKHIVDRLGHVEALVNQLLKAARQDGYLGPSPESLAAEIHQWGSRNASDSEESPVQQSGLETSAPPSQPVSQSDMDVLLGMPVETSQVIRAVTCARADSNDSALPSLKILLQLPPKGSHPALVARKLLVLATFLQGIPGSSSHQLDSLSTPYQTTMFRAVTTAHDLVTSNDDLVASLEGIECILLEALFKNYTGDLRQSWLAARRAVTIAQMLGLDRGIAPLSLSGFPVDPDDVWFRIVQFDRYIALMLGLPQSSVQDTFATPQALEKCSPLERMLRLCCVACGRILQRSAPELHDASLTQEVDKLLQDASAKMPPQFWVSPNLISCTSQSDKVREILRFNNHFMYYNILLQLHLPHFLTSKTQQESYHNKLVAITASREILSRYVSFRASQTTPYYCRGIDLVTFIPCTALSLAYLSDRNRCPIAPDTLPFTAHQRLSDRGLLEQTLAIMQGVVDVNGDAIAKRVATLLRYLLAIDEDAMSGGRYSVVFSPEIRKRWGGLRKPCGFDAQ
ncbi:Zn(II)2Cys6 transcription factor [Colletotrichum kahawae]|uniref:Zn(II)2Cys6 transcription factor n=1 Tax=Colletotrichum kahawae TaxID=34407 RepID=A0AAD9YXK3_COLKA|nr:Zn(II)2Cys6 transcription factor [Colletotrichum kahawae]